MIRLLLLVVIAGVVALLIWRVHAGKLKLRFSTWPVGQQIEMALAALLAVAALLGLAAGELNFAGWLALVSATIAALALLSWPEQG
ncbi:MAG: hypothetical protein M3O62_12085 [Pseudomonadota bacterium]|nr:hypothetical protein [Pseudomonadota bacterium]